MVLGVAIAVLLAGLAAAVWTVWLRPDDAGPSTAVPRHLAPDELAAQACAYATQTLPRQVADDVAADDVLAGLDQARSVAQTAADRDPSWVALASGLATLQRAVQADDPGATDLALRVVQAECR